MTNLSIVINNYADQEECDATIQSIRETGPDGVDVVVIDDGSPERYVCKDGSARVFRCERRIGCGPSRALGIRRAKHDWVLIIDSHMRFVPGWYDAVRHAQKEPHNVVWCGQCLGLRPGMMDVSKATSRYNGATLLFTGPDTNSPGRWQVLEGKWAPQEPGDCYPLASIMGACYLSHRSWYLYIDALGWLKKWGVDEQSLSIRTWMLGGECRMLGGLRVGHQFRARSFHTNPTGCQIYNKLRLAKVCFPEEAFQRILSDISKQYRMPGDTAQARKWLELDAPQIEVDRAFIEENTRLRFEGFLDKFGLPVFWQ